jgi:DNA-nicking Smr family endonuclease
MNTRHVDLHGLTLAEAEAKVRELIDATQGEFLEDCEAMMINHGPTNDELAAELARQRAEHVRLREQAIERMRVMVGAAAKF